MPSSHPNQTARMVAVIALVAAFILVAIVVATSSGGDEGNGGDEGANERSHITREGREALAKGEYVVEPGDTLVKIARITGTSVDELSDLNPDIDPQALLSGQKVKLPPDRASSP